jgi:hypothetical protein
VQVRVAAQLEVLCIARLQKPKRFGVSTAPVLCLRASSTAARESDARREVGALGTADRWTPFDLQAGGQTTRAAGPALCSTLCSGRVDKRRIGTGGTKSRSRRFWPEAVKSGAIGEKLIEATSI